jgi:hypothetical protein
MEMQRFLPAMSSGVVSASVCTEHPQLVSLVFEVAVADVSMSDHVVLRQHMRQSSTLSLGKAIN